MVEFKENHTQKLDQLQSDRNPTTLLGTKLDNRLADINLRHYENSRKLWRVGRIKRKEKRQKSGVQGNPGIYFSTLWIFCW